MRLHSLFRRISRGHLHTSTWTGRESLVRLFSLQTSSLRRIRKALTRTRVPAACGAARQQEAATAKRLWFGFSSHV